MSLPMLLLCFKAKVDFLDPFYSLYIAKPRCSGHGVEIGIAAISLLTGQVSCAGIL